MTPAEADQIDVLFSKIASIIIGMVMDESTSAEKLISAKEILTKPLPIPAAPRRPIVGHRPLDRELFSIFVDDDQKEL
jgi:hypothetical protein